MEETELNRYLELASVGSTEATLILFDYYCDNYDFYRAFNILIRIKNTNDPIALRKIAKCFENGIGTEKDIDSATSYYKQAFENGDTISGFNLALSHYYKKEYDLAVPYLAFNAANNHLQSLKMLAEFYLKGYGVVQDAEIAINFYKKVIELGENNYVFNVGKILFDEARYKESYEYLTKAKMLGDVRPLSYLSKCNLLGYGTEKNISKSIEFLNEGISMNDVNCFLQLALLYEKGIGVKKDAIEAEKLRKQAEILRQKSKEIVK